MVDSKSMLERVNEALRESPDGFGAYTERDDSPWYIIAGYRDSWHGLQRVADTYTSNRDKARAFLLYMMGRETKEFEFSVVRRSSLSWEFACNGDEFATVWCDEACRAFPDWTARIGMTPRERES